MDNDPLSPTDEVLLGFQQVSKSASQQATDMRSLDPNKQNQCINETDSNPSASQLVSLSNGQPLDPSASQPVNLLGDQQTDLLASQPVRASGSQLAGVITSQQTDVPAPRPANLSNHSLASPSTRQLADLPDSAPASVPNSQPVSLIESQLANKPILRKSTFQLMEAILQRLDVFHLQLQLELGKAKAPYKEVIVEEAICQLLALSDRQQLLAALQQRQSQRSH
jgi:hypothetical protein